MDIIERISNIGIVPVIKINDVNDACGIAEALIKGGLPVAEVTFRTACAKEAMQLINEKYPEMILGAGTVLTKEQVDDAIEAGAKFIVSPGFNGEIVDYCISKNIPMVPGCQGPAEIEAALSRGLTVVKFFPAENLGGLKMIKALAGPYVNVRFMPTGGIKPTNVNEYLACDKIVACGGTWMIDQEAIKNHDYKRIEELTAGAVKTMLGMHVKHIGINCDSEYDETVADLSNLLNVEVRDTSKGCFVGDEFEIMKNSHMGTKGHIALGVNSVPRAYRYLKEKGYEFDEATMQYDDKNRLKFVYLTKEFSGFRIHLVNN